MAFSINSQAVKNLNVTISLAGNTGTPYTITTGMDDNGDLIFNDRPIGVGRNAARAPGQQTWSVNGAYRVQAGQARVTFTVNATNMTNHANFGG